MKFTIINKNAYKTKKWGCSEITVTDSNKLYTKIFYFYYLHKKVTYFYKQIMSSVLGEQLLVIDCKTDYCYNFAHMLKCYRTYSLNVIAHSL